MVLARKWRPQDFTGLVGQEHVAQTLSNAIENKRIPHGYLFTGTRGVGKTSAARILTKALNCIEGPTPNPCGKCENCLDINQGTFIDVLEIDGASNRSVDDVRELREQVRYAPSRGKYKVYIIDEVHMLTKEAFNALLKTLEEPPANVIFIFATTELRKVPETILSRVQRFDFKRIPEAKLKKRLQFICEQEGITAEEEALDMIARRGDGSMRDTLSYFDQIFAFGGEKIDGPMVRDLLGVPPWEMYRDLFLAISQKNTKDCLTHVDSVYAQGFEIEEFLMGMGEYLRHLVFAGQRGMSAEAMGFSELQFKEFKNNRSDCTDEDLIRYGTGIADILRELKQSANPRLAVEMGVVRLSKLDKSVALEDLFNRVEKQIALEGENPPEPPPESAATDLKKKSLN